MKITLSVAFALIIPATAVSQTGNPGSRLSVDTRVTSVAAAGDTISVSFVLANSSSSAEDMFTFIVDAPAPIVRINVPTPAGWYAADTQWIDRSAAVWGLLGEDTGPGTVSPQFTMAAVGLPAIVNYWVMGYFEPPDADTTGVGDPDMDYLLNHSVTGWTVGVTPFPPDTSAPALTARLGSLVDDVCAKSWINSSTTCASLTTHVNQLSTDVQGGGGATSIVSFLNYVADNRLPAGAINDAAYWLLRINGEFIQRRIP